MKKAYILILALIAPAQGMASDKDSVYTWGKWVEGIQPAAGAVNRVAPAPARMPNINFRPNENQALTRVASIAEDIASPVSVVIPAAPILPNEPQLDEIVSAPADAPTISVDDLPATTEFILN